MLKRNYKSLLVFFLIIIAVQYASAMVTFPAVQGWYKTLAKPSFNPPDWVFGPVWTALYIMIAISGWMVWDKLTGTTWQRLKTRTMKTYFWQLTANFIWSFLFFGLHNPVMGFLDILILLGLIVLTIYRFAKVSRPAAYLLVPYLLWVSYATLLNYSIVNLNP
jgi:tryptophan-rich sensory protein